MADITRVKPLRAAVIVLRYVKLSLAVARCILLACVMEAASVDESSRILNHVLLPFFLNYLYVFLEYFSQIFCISRSSIKKTIFLHL